MSERPLDKLVAELLRQAKGIGVSYATESNIGEICARSLAMQKELTAANQRVAELIADRETKIELWRRDNARLRELLSDASKAIEAALCCSLPSDVSGMRMIEAVRETWKDIKAELAKGE